MWSPPTQCPLLNLVFSDTRRGKNHDEMITAVGGNIDVFFAYFKSNNDMVAYMYINTYDGTHTESIKSIKFNSLQLPNNIIHLVFRRL